MVVIKAGACEDSALQKTENSCVYEDSSEREENRQSDRLVLISYRYSGGFALTSRQW